MNPDSNTPNTTIVVNRDHYIMLMGKALGLIHSDQSKTPNALLSELLDNVIHKKTYHTIQDRLFEVNLIVEFISLQVTEDNHKNLA